MRIVTVTLNPALDKTAELKLLQPGQLNRLTNLVIDAGGKGINVSKMVAALGGESIATGFIGGGSGEEIVRALDKLGIAHSFVRIKSATRTNLKVVDQLNHLTELNEPGPRVTPEDTDSLLDKLRRWADPDSLFVLSGSIPAGMGSGIYGDIIRLVRAAGAKVFLDADGEAFKLALAAKPNFIKPNRYEILKHYGISSQLAVPELIGLARRLLADGVERIALSMGEDGALFVTVEEALFCPALPVTGQSSVGAGDSMVGAFAYGESQAMSWRDAAALAMAASAGAVTTVGTKPPSRELVDNLLTRVKFTVL
ncbi:MAG: 1-phosphofructokinase [Planctomycetota bacterium]|jgi:1-phosphofructokinase|nr:1-phosphofructokinase [Planctomycetota bacterium]